MRPILICSTALITLGAALACASATAQNQPPMQRSTPATNAAQTQTPEPAGQTGAARAGSSKTGMLQQNQALGLLSVINKAEINAGQLAAKQATGASAKNYAQLMIKEHTDNEAKLMAWKPDMSSAPAKAKMAEAKAEAAALAKKQGRDFDMAYLQAMVMDHEKALKALDSKIIPAATDPAVVAFLKETRTHVAAHLQQAQALVTSGGKSN